jgi:hypothetical protein
MRSEPIRILQDDDGHTYFVPLDKENDFHEWLAAVEAGEEWSGVGFEGYEIGGALSCFVFYDPEVR